jgi:hypothetical protein
MLWSTCTYIYIYIYIYVQVLHRVTDYGQQKVRVFRVHFHRQFVGKAKYCRQPHHIQHESLDALVTSRSALRVTLKSDQFLSAISLSAYI